MHLRDAQESTSKDPSAITAVAQRRQHYSFLGHVDSLRCPLCAVREVSTSGQIAAFACTKPLQLPGLPCGEDFYTRFRNAKVWSMGN